MFDVCPYFLHKHSHGNCIWVLLFSAAGLQYAVLCQTVVSYSNLIFFKKLGILKTFIRRTGNFVHIVHIFHATEKTATCVQSRNSRWICLFVCALHCCVVTCKILQIWRFSFHKMWCERLEGLVYISKIVLAFGFCESLL